MSRTATLLCLASLLRCCAQGSGETRPVVFAYLPEWRYHAADFNTMCKHVTHLSLFSAEPGPHGEIWGLDRLPTGAALADARAAATEHGCKLLLCFGGNGRSSHFSAVSRSGALRKKFVAAVASLVAEYNASGLDYNWEYPGFAFGSGYKAQAEVAADYKGFRQLVKQTRAALGAAATLTLAYYPDLKQEQNFVSLDFARDISFFHAMSYDQGGEQHSPYSLAVDTIENALDVGLNLRKVTIGVPFYGRTSGGGDWVTFEDLVQRNAPLGAHLNVVPDGKGGSVGFNGRDLIAAKTRLAMNEVGGIMIWEVGQDCRQVAVTRDGATHSVTCPFGRNSSLLAAVADTIDGVYDHPMWPARPPRRGAPSTLSTEVCRETRYMGEAI